MTLVEGNTVANVYNHWEEITMHALWMTCYSSSIVYWSCVRYELFVQIRCHDISQPGIVLLPPLEDSENRFNCRGAQHDVKLHFSS